MAVAVADFEKCAMKLEPTPIDKDLKYHTIWIVASHFCRMRFLNDAMYFLGDTFPPRMDIYRNNVVSVPLSKHNYTI